MCVALPGKVIELDKGDALVDFHGNQVRAKAGLVDVSVGGLCAGTCRLHSAESLHEGGKRSPGTDG